MSVEDARGELANMVALRGTVDDALKEEMKDLKVAEETGERVAALLEVVMTKNAEWGRTIARSWQSYEQSWDQTRSANHAVAGWLATSGASSVAVTLDCAREGAPLSAFRIEVAAAVPTPVPPLPARPEQSAAHLQRLADLADALAPFAKPFAARLTEVEAGIAANSSDEDLAHTRIGEEPAMNGMKDGRRERDSQESVVPVIRREHAAKIGADR